MCSVLLVMTMIEVNNVCKAVVGGETLFGKKQKLLVTRKVLLSPYIRRNELDLAVCDYG